MAATAKPTVETNLEMEEAGPKKVIMGVLFFIKKRCAILDLSTI